MTYIHTAPWALYNEIDEFAAAWLEQLIARGLIARGIVDRRSIVDIRPDDLRGFRQVHLFAGIGVWSYSFRRAGITDDTEAWSASCPCQPFSSAGEGGGMDDERHLWPHAHHLIRERRPRLVFGEQVASKDGLAWLDLVQADLAGTGYAFGAIDTCAAGFGAPHIRQRQYWFGERLEYTEGDGRLERGTEPSWRGIAGGCGDDGLADDDLSGSTRHRQHGRSRPTTSGVWDRPAYSSGDEFLGHTTSPRWKGKPHGRSPLHAQFPPAERTGDDARGLAYDDDDKQWQGGNSRGTSGEGLRLEPGRCGNDLGLADFPSDGREPGARHASEGPQFAELGFGDGFCDLGLADAHLINDDGAGSCAGPVGGELEGPEDLLGFFDPFRVVDPHRRGTGTQRGGSGKTGGKAPGGARANDGSALPLRTGAPHGMGHNRRTGPTNGFWGDVDWLHCRDERWRPVEPGTFPLAHGATARVGRLRGYGNAINAEQAIGFIEAYLETKAIEIEVEPVRNALESDFEDLI